MSDGTSMSSPVVGSVSSCRAPLISRSPEQTQSASRRSTRDVSMDVLGGISTFSRGRWMGATAGAGAPSGVAWIVSVSV